MITGMNGGTGVGGVDPDQLPGPAALGEVGDDAVGGADRQQVHDAGLQRHRDERKVTVSSMIERITTPPMNSGSRSWVTSPWSTNDAVVPPTLTGEPRAREDVGAQVADQVAGLGRLRRGGGRRHQHGGVARGVDGRLRRRRRSRLLAQAARQRGQLGLVGRCPAARPRAGAGRWRRRRSPWTRGRRPGGWWSSPGRCRRPGSRGAGRGTASRAPAAPAAAAIAATHGRRCTPRLQRAAGVVVGSAAALRSVPGIRSRSMLVPAKPSSAGSSVTEAAIVTEHGEASPTARRPAGS